MITLETPPTDTRRTTLWRSRWAAIGAAVAVSFGAGGVFVAQAVPGPSESTIVSVAPERVLDTRNGNDIGLPGPFVSAVAQKLQVTGSIPTATGTKIVVPTGATGVLLNVTPVGPTAAGFVAIRPGDATGAASTSSLNFTAGGISPNSVQVSLPTAGANAGQIDITFDAYGVAGPTTDILIDIVGYTTNTGLQQLVANSFLPVKTVLAYTGSNTDFSIAGDYELLRTVGVFTKRRGDTALRLDWSGHHERSGGTFCHYQLRINGNTNDGSSSLVSSQLTEGNAISFALEESLSTFAEFPGLPAGNHTVGIYVRGSATSCRLNPLNFNQQVLVEEYLGSTLSVFDAPASGGDGELVQSGS
jgi:hypothetical protein